VHYLLVESGSARGTAVLNEVPYREAAKDEAGLAERLVQEAAQRMGKELDAANVREALSANFDHPEWEAVAKRCLSCANCTMVCPTCFCSTVEDTTDLTGDHAERWRRWDSCFTLDFARVAGGSFRSSSRARYRQWLTHKFGSWYDQFGTSGCVGCGRCITWCPVGIDVTEEVHRIKQSLPEELEHAY
jgi:ferredoxin